MKLERTASRGDAHLLLFDTRCFASAITSESMNELGSVTGNTGSEKGVNV